MAKVTVGAFTLTPKTPIFQFKEETSGVEEEEK